MIISKAKAQDIYLALSLAWRGVGNLDIQSVHRFCDPGMYCSVYW